MSRFTVLLAAALLAGLAVTSAQADGSDEVVAAGYHRRVRRRSLHASKKQGCALGLTAVVCTGGAAALWRSTGAAVAAAAAAAEAPPTASWALTAASSLPSRTSSTTSTCVLPGLCCSDENADVTCSEARKAAAMRIASITLPPAAAALLRLCSA